MLPGPEEIAIAIRRLREGGLVAFPTETVYGLGAIAFDERAVARVFELKGRPAANPLIVHVSGVGMARACVTDWPERAEKLAREFWPGPLSIVLPRSARIPANVTGGGPNVAVRCPDHPLTLALLEALGAPLVGPSANTSGAVSPTCAEHVRESFTEEEVYVLDGGPCIGGIESTVLSLAGPVPVELRPGLITPEQIEAVIGVRPAKLVRGPAAPAEGPLPSPGLLERHYAPRTPTVMVDGPGLAVAIARAAGPAVILTHEPVAVGGPHRVELLPADARAYASALYAALRRADRAGAGLIIIRRPPEGGPDAAIWSAILDRLSRAAAPRGVSPSPGTGPATGGAS